MSNTLEYEVSDIINSSTNFTNYKAYSPKHNKVVCIKSPASSPAPDNILFHLKNEYNITSGTTIEGVRKVYEYTTFNNKPALILEYINGKTLYEEDYNNLNFTTIINIIVELCKIIEQLHKSDIIHMDINPSNIIYDNSKVTLIDFGISSNITVESRHFHNIGITQGSLSYISPEQTGRMNRNVDKRTDYYSLGIVMYELLTKRLPFYSDDQMELIHLHIAQQPTAPQLIDDNIPKALSDITLKLLEKNAEDRYKSISGLLYDLELSKHSLEKGEFPQFKIATHDFHDAFQIPQKLYGRENELNLLTNIFQEVINTGDTQLITVEGIAGIGKSLLVNELSKFITNANGTLISGKFDQLKQNLPYFAFTQALNEQVYKILTESNEVLLAWKTKIIENVGSNGQLIIDLIPDVELIIGSQPKLDELPTIQAQNRFEETFVNFVSTFSSSSSPLVIFIDDLQWADAASLNFIQLLLDSKIITHVLLIGAYRNNEVDESHFLSVSLSNITEAGHKIRNIQVGAINSEAISKLLAEALNTDTPECEELAKLINKKTEGNPFFIIQLLRSLDENGAFIFDSNLNKWTYDIEQINKVAISNNILDIIVEKIKKLDHKDQEVLKLASCIGNRFSLKTLTFICDESISHIVMSLWIALKEGFIKPMGKNINPIVTGELEITTQNMNYEYSFVHDRIHQSFYSLIDSSKKIETHLAIGQLLLHNIAENELENDLYNVLDQCNRGKSLIKDEKEMQRLIELNLLAGTKAKEANAYKSALSYLSTSLELLDNDSWTTDYATCFKLYVNAGECAYLSGDLDTANTIFKKVFDEAKTNYDKAKVCSIQIGLYSNLGNLNAAKEVGLRGLRLLNFGIPDKGSKIKVLLSLLQLKFKLRGVKDEHLLDRPPLENKDAKLALFMLIELQAAIFTESPELLALSLIKAMNITLEHGNGYMSYNAYSGYGAILALGLGQYKKGWQLTKIGYELTKKSGSDFFLSRGNYAMGITVIHWNMHSKKAIPYLEKGYQLGIQSGDFTNTAQLSMSLLVTIFTVGTPLEKVLYKAVQYHEFANKIKYADIINFHSILINTIEQLMGVETSETAKTLDETLLIERINQSTFVTSRMMYKTMKLQLLCLLGEYTQAQNYITESDQEFDSLKVSSVSADYLTYKAIVYTEFYGNATKAKKLKYKIAIKGIINTLKKWSTNAPENFQHKHDLCKAEYCRINNDILNTIKYYKLSITGAKENEYIQYEALANERAGVFFLAQEYKDYARFHLAAALSAYTLWGSKRKVLQMKEKYESLLAVVPIPEIHSTGKGNTTSLHSTTSSLDFKSLIKASQTISREIVLEKLLSTMMKIVVENAGANEGYLIMKKNENFIIQTKFTLNTNSVNTVQNNDINTSKDIPRTIIQYVQRTKNNVVIHNASSEEAKFANDPVIQAKKSKSILCSPIINQEQIIGVLYLENSLTTNAFNSQRIEILDLLSGQIAVTLHNALLYDSMEQKVVDRTREIEQQKEALKRTNLELLDINQEKNDLIGVVSHDLRSPLNQVKGLAKLISLTDGNNKDEKEEYVNRIISSVDRLNAMITRILDISAIESQKLKLAIESLNVAEVIEEQIINFSILAREKDIEILVNKENEELLLNLDKSYFIQVINNLLSNAIKFSAEKDVVTVTITKTPTPLIEIKDSGPGISESDQKKLFNKFQKLTAQPTAGEGSSGLGLSIVKKYVDAMGGEIWCESELGKGTSFFIRF